MDLRQPDLRALIAAAIVAATGSPALASPPLPDGVGMLVRTHGEADVHSRTASGTPLRWAGSCVFVRPHAAGTTDIPGDQEWTVALAGATAAWEAAAGGCGYLQFRLETPEAGESTLDFVNRVIVREDRWCRPGPPEKCYDSGSVGITTLYFVERAGDPDDGVILDADIELNAVDYALALCAGNPGGCTTTGSGLVYDLQNLLTHELGHLLGLSHTCRPDAGGDQTDDDGVPLPLCVPPLPPEITEATMYNYSDPEETKKRTPEAEDVDWFCRRYPTAGDPAVCAPVPPIDPVMPDAATGPGPGDSGGCGCRSSSPATGCLVLAVMLILVGRRRRC